jgi:hypothetical protein
MSNTLTPNLLGYCAEVTSPVSVDLMEQHANDFGYLINHDPDMMSRTYHDYGGGRENLIGYDHKAPTPERPRSNFSDDFRMGPRSLARWEAQFPDASAEFKDFILNGDEILRLVAGGYFQYLNSLPPDEQNALARHNFSELHRGIPTGLSTILMVYARKDMVDWDAVPDVRRRFINYPHIDNNTLSMGYYTSEIGFCAVEGDEDGFDVAHYITPEHGKAIIFPGSDLQTIHPEAGPGLMHAVEAQKISPGGRVTGVGFLHPSSANMQEG